MEAEGGVGVDGEPPRRRWAEVAEAASSGLAAWRAPHPAATSRAIEAAAGERLAAARARMPADAARARAATGLEGSARPARGRPRARGHAGPGRADRPRAAGAVRASPRHPSRP